VPPVPEDNPMTIEKVELGRRLFFDARLSANQSQSCASCHRPELAFTDGASVATGSTGQKHRRSSMSLANVAYNSSYTWAHSGITTIEQHILIPLFGETPIEMGAGGNEQEILSRVSTDPSYRALFADAYPYRWNRITFDTVSKAMASYVRSLTSFGSPFDRYAFYGDDAAFTSSQVRGMNLFMSERLECSHCHNGFNFSQFVTHDSVQVQDRPFHVTGLYNAVIPQPDFDRGLSAVTSDLGDRDKFKAPTLRNIDRTAPYMHDGSIATLSDVVDFYAAAGRNLVEGPRAGDGRVHPAKSAFVKGFVLTSEEKEDLLNFLHGLTDEEFLGRAAPINRRSP